MLIKTEVVSLLQKMKQLTLEILPDISIAMAPHNISFVCIVIVLNQMSLLCFSKTFIKTAFVKNITVMLSPCNGTKKVTFHAIRDQQLGTASS